MLINIKKLREDNKYFQLLLYLFVKKITEQDIFAYACQPKIGYLPFKYGMFFFGGIKSFISYINRKYDRVNLTEIEESMKDPTIIHNFYTPKHWKKRTKNPYEKGPFCDKYLNDFYDYAKKTKYYQSIYNIYIK